MKQIIIAGGCFWGVERYYQQLRGVISTRVGYTDGEKENPSYREVCDSSGHVEAVKIVYDESLITLSQLMEHFFRIVDPTQRNRQGHDMGVQYRNGVFVNNKEDQRIVQAILAEKAKEYSRPLATFVKEETPFYDAEEYHQDYLIKNPGGYCHINMALLRPEEKKG